jgi:predicted DNA-binding protein (MmcQ/YjbR family)
MGARESKSVRAAREAEAELRDIALGYPEAWEDHPWGDRVIKVRQKIFLFLGSGDGTLSLSVKLPLSHSMALAQPGTRPTAYGLGRAGWVSAQFGPGEHPPTEMLRDWIDESYRAVAPKKLQAEIVRTPTDA